MRAASPGAAAPVRSARGIAPRRSVPAGARRRALDADWVRAMRRHRGRGRAAAGGRARPHRARPRRPPPPFCFFSSQADAATEPTITLLTADGFVVLGGGPRPAGAAARARARAAARPPLPTLGEASLVLAAPWTVTAHSPADAGRVVRVHGWTRDPLSLPGDVAAFAADARGGLLGPPRAVSAPGALGEPGVCVAVALPLLHGVPPALDALLAALAGSGHLVERIVKSWRFDSW